MQKEIRKHATFYGITAIILAGMLSALCYNFGVIPNTEPSPSPPLQYPAFLNTFTSRDEIRNYLAKNPGSQGPVPFYGPSDIRFLGPEANGVPVTEPSMKIYSTTNIQVEGVDEIDNVKTDGTFIYLVSGNNIYILKAYPPDEARMLSEITLNDTYIAGIFVSGNRLAVLASKYIANYPVLPWDYYYATGYYVDVKTFVRIYDITDKEDPLFLTDFTMSGSYFNSRMIGDYVYLVVSQPAYIIYDTVVLPKVYTKTGTPNEISPPTIHYVNASDSYYMYTTVVAMNMQNITEAPTHETIMLGGTSSMYVSLNNMYIAFSDYGETFFDYVEQTSIYRVHLENSIIRWEANGKVNGHVLNQFSMDEYGDYFRIATTTTMWANGTAQNNLYVLDMNLSIVGSLENFAPPDEVMDAARFIGNRCYLSTSVMRKDPFFVIDLTNANEPKILGDLKIPGFTRYLHPYDDDHVIGVGKDGNNVKITLFDVSNVSAPINMTGYTVEGYWSDSLVLSDHKAFLFDKTRELLAIPISITGDFYADYWQGAYVFNINLASLVLKGTITHMEDGVYEWDSNYWITRELYIEDTLYTFSAKKVKMNSLDDLHLINKIEFP